MSWLDPLLKVAHSPLSTMKVSTFGANAKAKDVTNSQSKHSDNSGLLPYLKKKNIWPVLKLYFCINVCAMMFQQSRL